MNREQMRVKVAEEAQKHAYYYFCNGRTAEFHFSSDRPKTMDTFIKAILDLFEKEVGDG